MGVYSSLYTIELWTKSGQLLMDLSRIAKNRKLTKSRNEPDVLTFDLDLDDFEKACVEQNVDPKTILIPGQTEARIKRQGTYMSGGQLVYLTTSITDTANTIQCQVFGFLWLLSQRYTGDSNNGLSTVLNVHTAAYGTAKSRRDLAQYLVNATQALPNGDFGITIGPNQASNNTLYDKAYSRTNIKDALQDLTKLQTAPIDIEITYDKKLNTYDQQGSVRSDVLFEFPDNNIKRVDVPIDATGIANEVIGLGSGAQDGSGVVRYAIDTSSEVTYGLRQEILQTNGTDDSDGGVTDAANAEKAAKRNPISIPAITVDGSIGSSITDYGIGDWINIKIAGHLFASNINGLFRLEKFSLNIGDDDSEGITLEVSDV